MSRIPREISDFIVREDLCEVDPDTDLLIGFERRRQAERLILIPSESIAPNAVRKALGSVFNNLYAEGYPPLKMTRQEAEETLDYRMQLARYRRYSDRRFYQGTEYANFVEALAQRRCAECFATDQVPADRIFVNVQPLSGAAANNVVYAAFVEPGATVMGLALSEGGHLTHGSEFNRSGKRYRAVPYHVDPQTERLDYDAIMELALEHRPRLIIAGYTSYSWAPDWGCFREIADAVGDCILLADIAHPAGMVIADEYPSPVGYADVITFTTHKTLCGPRAAVIMTTEESRAREIDETVFPGEQGGPHVNKFAAMAVAFKIARTHKFRQLQQQIVANARALANSLLENGVPLAYGGTDTHLCVADLRTFKGEHGFPLKGEMAARILDLCGVVVNKNTIPGDETAADASGIRLGTPWITQRGLTQPDIQRLAELIANTLRSIQPFSYDGPTGLLPRGKVQFDVLEDLKRRGRELIEATLVQPGPVPGDSPRPSEAVPLDTEELTRHLDALCEAIEGHALFAGSKVGVLSVRGEWADAFVQNIVTSDVSGLQPGANVHTFMLDECGHLIDDVVILKTDGPRESRYLVIVHSERRERVLEWLRGHSDGYVVFDTEDIYRKIQGPVVIEDLTEATIGEDRTMSEELARRCTQDPASDRRREAGLPGEWDAEEIPTGLELYEGGHSARFDLWKPYFVGQRLIERTVQPDSDRELFTWEAKEKAQRRTPLFKEHQKLMPRFVEFAGWEMPVWYTSVSDEHAAVRTSAGLFDIGHMGVLEVCGEHAASFLDIVTSNYVGWLEVGQCHYSYILDLDGVPMDDIIVYRQARDRFLLVINAVNSAKILAWLEAVNSRAYVIDREFPHRDIEGCVTLRDLQSQQAGEDRRTGLAIQGPCSAAILRDIRQESRLGGPLSALRKFEFIEDTILNIPALISRTGYTGEEIGFEIYVHPDHVGKLWGLLLEAGEEYGIRPAGLGARDATRIEAGLPLYGHELAGPQKILPTAAGYGAYIKLHKPFFIGRSAFVSQESDRGMQIVRFRLDSDKARAVSNGDLVASTRGEYVGTVTSCALVGDRQIGMAYVASRMEREGTPLLIYPMRHARKATTEPAEELSVGDQMMIHERATVIPRFLEENRATLDKVATT